jgi:hypothetical protein
MTDIICISPQAFTLVKDMVEIDPKIDKIYTNLLSSYTCFTSTNIQYEPHIRAPKQHKHLHVKNMSEARKSVIHCSDPLKKVKGLLNIINTSNFDKINRKLQFTINDKNAHDVCMLLINTACGQIFFVHVFMKLLNHCIQTTPKVLDTCVKFVDDFFKDTSFFNMNHDAIGGVSQDFTEYQTIKKRIINTSIVIMEMIKNQYTKQYNIQVFITYIILKLQQSTSHVETDILLCTLVEVKKRSANLKLDQTRLNNIKNLQCDVDSRIMFMFETLLK